MSEWNWSEYFKQVEDPAKFLSSLETDSEYFCNEIFIKLTKENVGGKQIEKTFGMGKQVNKATKQYLALVRRFYIDFILQQNFINKQYVNVTYVPFEFFFELAKEREVSSGKTKYMNKLTKLKQYVLNGGICVNGDTFIYTPTELDVFLGKEFTDFSHTLDEELQKWNQY